MDMPNPHALTLREAFERFYVQDLTNRSTVLSYRGTVRRWEKMTNNPPVALIDNRLLQTFRDDCQKAGTAASTINGYWRDIRAILRRLGPQEYRNPLGLGILQRVPYMKMLKEIRDYPRIPTFAELDALYAACEMATWPHVEFPTADWWRTVLVLGYNVGARTSDIMDLQTSDIDFRERIVRFRARKTAKRQQIPLNAVALAHIGRIWGPRPKLFPAFSRRHFYTVLDKIRTAAGIDWPIGLQDFRKTCATQLAAVGGLDAAGYVTGHGISGNVVLVEYYVNAIPLIRQAIDKLPQPDSFCRIVADPLAQVNVARDHFRVFRSEWEFGHRFVLFRGQAIRMPKRPLALLRALVTAGRPLSADDLLRTCWPTEERSPVTVKTTLHQARVILSNALRLPAGWDPIPPRGDRYRISLPPNL